ncbi:MAG: cell division protein FtsL [Pseudomonadota bacterium]
MAEVHPEGRGGKAAEGVSKPILLFAAGIVVFIIVVAFKLHIQHRIIDIGYSMSQENNKKRTLLQEEKRLDLEIQYLRSPERLNEVAQNDFSMKIPAADQIMHLKSVRHDRQKAGKSEKKQQ